MSISIDQDATVGLFDSSIDPVLFRQDKHPIEYYIVFDRSVRGDLLLNNNDVVSYLSILEETLTLINFFRTMVSVSERCLKIHPRKYLRRYLWATASTSKSVPIMTCFRM